MNKKSIAAFVCGALLATAASVEVLGENPSDSSTVSPEEVGSAADHSVPVTREDISSVLSLDAELIARPSYQVPAPVAGTFSPRVHEGDTVDAGEVLGTVSGDKSVKLVAKARSKITNILASSGEAVPGGIAVFSLQDRSFALQADIAPSDRYRLKSLSADNQVRASIDNGPGPFSCPSLGGPQLSEDGNLSLLCTVPEDVTVFAGLKGIMAVSLERQQNALTLPISAVAGSADTGQVNLVQESGEIVHRDVKLGITDGVRIEIRSGLSEGQRVATQPPSLDSGEA
ncbi:biotin/lipoyl-containing protein [Streptomyces sp. STCH 565 A]|uniref:biotin/lipoyl-containing protein n=1 Tax=Streptomyces sp. STCH 565 A TaxID=2950532 RepID=UPI0020763CD1|nr:biotin/lipoyl-containing protein [Streptomyces sp. STCH 565 A]MCM8555974.1 hypothetical protein [Streptomyces sp. STCH 565 A]